MRTCVLAVVLAALPGLPLACGDDVPREEGEGLARCSDGVCKGTDCETPLRCPADCGTCLDEQCNLDVGMVAKCGSPCASSCDCGLSGEVCTADFEPGNVSGTCVPIACRSCSAGKTCKYTPDASGKCETATCE